MENKTLNEKQIEQLTQDLIQEKVNINTLNIARLGERTAFINAIDARPALLSKVNEANSEHLLNFAIEQNPTNFIYLTRDQYTEQLAQVFLYERLTESTNARGKGAEAGSYILNSTLVQKSLDNKIVLVYTHTTLDGDELYYLDKELDVPIAIKSSFKVSLKLNGALKLIDKLDTHITQLGELTVKTLVFDIINNQFKAYLNNYIEKNKAGYYTLCTSFSDIEAGFKATLDRVLASYGISVNNFIIKQLAIPKDIQDKIENLSFEIRQRRADVQADNEFAKISLENYEAKLAINEKYPNTEPTLTEYEKDLALKRYLIKIGKLDEAEIDHSINIQHRVTRADVAIEKTDDIIPDIKPKQNLFKALFITAAVMCAFISICVLIADVANGLITLGAFTALFGIIAATNADKFRTVEVEANVYGGAENTEAAAEETTEE